jgi:hypothetical protein
LPNRPKITQSGHPECATNFVTWNKNQAWYLEVPIILICLGL